MNYVDTHFHLDLFANPKQVVEILNKNKIYSIAVTNLPDLFDNTLDLISGSKYIRPALGYHPELSGTYNDKIDSFYKNLDRTKYVGEVGLDFSKQYDGENRNNQIKVFGQILDVCSEKKNKILTIHSRKSESYVINMIGNDFPGTIILHWFSGSISEAKEAIENGFYFSFNLSMTMSNKGKELLKYIPSDRILSETDSPFTTGKDDLSPHMEIQKIIIEIEKLSKNNWSVKDNIFRNFKDILNSTFH